MINSYILIVVSSVYYGVNISQQEYASLQACEFAAAEVRTLIRETKRSDKGISCVPKGN